MQRCRRCYFDDRTDEQVNLGIPHYCKGPRVRPPPPPPRLFDYNPSPAPISIDGAGPRLVWDPIFANSVLNSHGIPKHLEDSTKFSYDNSPYFKRPKYGLAALREQEASQDAGKPDEQAASTAPASGGDEDRVDIDMPQQPKVGLSEQNKTHEEADSAEMSAEEDDDTGVSQEEAPEHVAKGADKVSETTGERMEGIDDTKETVEEVQEATGDAVAIADEDLKLMISPPSEAKGVQGLLKQI